MCMGGWHSEPHLLVHLTCIVLRTGLESFEDSMRVGGLFEFGKQMTTQRTANSSTVFYFLFSLNVNLGSCFRVLHSSMQENGEWGQILESF